MSKSELLQLYKRNVDEIRNYAKNCNFTDQEINNILKDCFNSRRDRSRNVVQSSYSFFTFVLKIITIFIFISVVVYITLNVHQTVSSVVLRNVQGFIYPCLKFLRSLSVPIVKKFPTLTYFYDESCLVQNPYFYVDDMECWPCENVYSVIDITDIKNKSIVESGIPYLVKVKQQEVTFKDLQNMYKNNKNIFDENASWIKSNNRSLETVGNLFASSEEGILFPNSHITWRINRMMPTRIVRKLFPKPNVINHWSGQSIERFLFIDGPEASSYSLPNPECSYVFLIQGSGERTIVLKPSKECTNVCKTVSIVLKPSYVLWYNWWYWRPLSLPAKNATKSSITYMNSYC